MKWKHGIQCIIKNSCGCIVVVNKFKTVQQAHTQTSKLQILCFQRLYVYLYTWVFWNELSKQWNLEDGKELKNKLAKQLRNLNLMRINKTKFSTQPPNLLMLNACGFLDFTLPNIFRWFIPLFGRNKIIVLLLMYLHFHASIALKWNQLHFTLHIKNELKSTLWKFRNMTWIAMTFSFVYLIKSILINILS